MLKYGLVNLQGPCQQRGSNLRTTSGTGPPWVKPMQRLQLNGVEMAKANVGN